MMLHTVTGPDSNKGALNHNRNGTRVTSAFGMM